MKVYFVTLFFLLLGSGIVQANDKTVHVIEAGETFMDISFEYFGTHRKWKEIIAANPTLNPDELRVGDKVIIPSSHSETKKEIQKPVAPVAKVKAEAQKQQTKLQMAEIDVTAKVEKKKEPIKAKVHPEISHCNDSNTREEYLDLKEKHLITLRELESKNRSLEANVDLKEEKIKELEDEVFHHKSKITDLKKNDAKFIESHPLYQSNMLTYSSKQILQEKNRILTQKLWLEKNKNYGKCTLTLKSHTDKTSAELSRLIDYLNQKYGVPSVFVTSDDHTLYFKVPGKYVYGVSSPTLSSRAKRSFTEISELLEKLPVESLNVYGYSRYTKVKNERGQTVLADTLSLMRSLAVQDYFIDDLGWGKKRVKAVGVGYKKGVLNKYQKHFLVEVNFTSYKSVTRSLASQFKDDEAINKIQAEMLHYLNEPKYSNVSTSDHSLKLDLGRHYFFKSGSNRLSDRGKVYIDKVMEMLSLTKEVKYQISWTAGFFEKNYRGNKSKAISQLIAIKRYVDKKYPWVQDRLEIAFSPRQNTLKLPLSKSDDLFNSRISFHVIPLTISLREFNQFEFEKKKKEI
ncbi:MAG: OmpA family protein [Bacteriovoracaceae bacterium]